MVSTGHDHSDRHHRKEGRHDHFPYTQYLTRPAIAERVIFIVSAGVDLVPGTVFTNRYRVIRRIAAGGMGAVFEVLHLETQRRRALKVMHATLLQSEDLRERFRREATVAAHVDSEFIVDVFDAGVDEATGMPFLVMELLRGEELGERLKRVGHFEADEALNYLHYVGLALDKTHQASIIHRDLKPANVYLAEKEEGGVRVKVLDFGIAKIIAEGTSTGATTQSLGTPLYMAPEQFNPRSKLTNAVDIYALGMMAYTLLVGVPYWFEEARGGNVYAVVALAIHGIAEPASVRATARGIQLSAQFDAWFARATALDPKQRFPTASTAVQELALALGKGRQPRPSMASVNADLPQSVSLQATPAATNIASPATPWPSVVGSGTTKIGQLPESTSMSAAATSPKPTHSTAPWIFVLGGGIGALSLGLIVFFMMWGNTSTTPPNPAQGSNAEVSSSGNVAPMVSLAPPSPPIEDKPTPALTTQPPAASASTTPAPTPIVVRTSAPAAARTSAPATTSATTSIATSTTPPRKKSYTRE